MANYKSLKTTINANVKRNGNQEITGQILNSVLNAMVDTLGTGYSFAGVATPSTNPGTPDAKVFYIANGKGSYINFGGLQVTEDEVVVLYWDSLWHKESTGIAREENLINLGKEIATKQNALTDTDGGYGQRVANLEKEGIASQEKLTELESKVEDITREAAEDENETITIETNNGDIIASIDENGADFIGLKKGGKNVVATELIQEISTEEEEEEIIFEGDNGKEIISIGKNGLKVPKIEAESVVLTNSTTDINITSDDSITIEDGRCCSFIEGGSYLIKGVGNAIINISFASKSFSDVSYGFMWSWESQQIASLIAQGITIKKYDESSAEKYRIQGGTFQRINKHDSSSDSVFEVKSDSSDAWSLLITKKAERFVKPSVKPICIIYDGGRWQGQVYWEGQLYKIWDLHRKLDIPYAVALYSTQMEPSSGTEYTCDEVRRDIESGLCEVIVRNVLVNKDNDSAYLDGIKSEQSLLKVTSKATILASHHLTPLIFRCSVKDGADFIRQYPFFDTDGILACKYSDSPYKAIHSSTIPISLNEQTNFWLPQIYWAHGVGIPPEGETMYSDTTGENTQNGFRQLLSLVKDGKVQILHPSDFAQYCKNSK